MIKTMFFTFLVATLLPIKSLAAIPVSDNPVVMQRNVNLLSKYNNGFESGKAKWTASGGSFTIATNGTNLQFDTSSAVFNASAGSQTLTSSALAVGGLAGMSGYASCYFKTTATDYKIQMYDGTNVLNQATIPASTAPFETGIYAPIPSSGSVYLRIISASDAADLSADNCYLGTAPLTPVSQANLIASAYFPLTSTCEWSASSTSFVDFGTVAACPGPTVDFSDGVTVLTTDTDLPQITLNNLPAGKYRVTVTGTGTQGAAGAVTGYAVSDGTTRDGDVQMRVAATNSDIPQFTVIGVFNYTSAQGSKTFKMQGAASSSSSRIFNGTGYVNGTKGLRFTVERFPSASEIAVRADTIGWKIDANISGANISLGASNISSYTEMTNGSLTLTNNTGNGNISAQIACASGTDSSGTTCSAANESNGITFTNPAAGDVLACANFSFYKDANDGYAIFQIVETTPTSSTIVQEGKSRIGAQTVSGEFVAPMRVCGTFNFSGSSRRTLRLVREQAVISATSLLVLADANGTYGQRDIHWEVYPLNQQIPAPIIMPDSTSEIVLDTYTSGSQFGSTNTEVFRYSNAYINTGTSFTPTFSTTLGASVTLNESGLYCANGSYLDQGVAGSFAITKNAIASGGTGTTMCRSAGQAGAARNANACSACFRAVAGDVIRAIGSGATDQSSSAGSQNGFFRMVKAAR